MKHIPCKALLKGNTFSTHVAKEYKCKKEISETKAWKTHLLP